MPKRQTKRKVIIHLKQRNPSDPLPLLQAVEEAYRPREIEIIVEEPSDPPDAAPPIPDEQLETAAREHAAEVLDEQDRRLREAPKGRAAKPQSTRRGIRNWLKKWVAAGWRIFVKLLPVVEQAAKTTSAIAKAVDDIPR